MGPEVDLRVKLGTIELPNPVLVCSGTFGCGREYSEWMELGRLGGLVTKSVTPEPVPGNPPPRLWETPCGLLNSIGWENGGLDQFLEEELPFLRDLGIPVIVSVAGFTHRDYLTVSTRLSEEDSVAALEINLSCPNVERGGLSFCHCPDEASALVGEIKERVGKPVLVKLSYRVSGLPSLCRLMEEAGADGISLINSLPAMAIDPETALPRLGNVTGGLSGPAIHPLAVLAVWEAYASTSLPIVGMGGIWGWEDAVEFILAGATAVGVGTLNFRDPRGSLRVLDGIREYLVRKGYCRVEDLVGMAHRRLKGWKKERAGKGLESRE
ncbi:MAG: dihydroorotate dehydrogenase [Candidatus Geothermincolales bacterium]